jgi:DNA repair protein RadC
MNQTITKPGRISQLIEAVENLAVVQPIQVKAKTGGKSRISSRALKRHLKYIVPEMRLALIKEPGLKPKAITSAEDLDKFIEPLKFYSEAHFVSFHLSAKFEVVGFQIVSRGTLSASLVHPREVFKTALIANSYAIIVAHNHPGGSLKPSPEDLETTEQLIKAGKLLGVSVLDHVIVASSGFISLRQDHPNLWFES